MGARDAMYFRRRITAKYRRVALKPMRETYLIFEIEETAVVTGLVSSTAGQWPCTVE